MKLISQNSYRNSWKTPTGQTRWLWNSSRINIFFNLDTQWLQKVWTFEFLPSVFEKVILTGLSSLQKKRCLNSIWYFMILPKKTFFQNIKIKLNSNAWMTLKSSVVIFRALKTSAASFTSATSTTSLALTASTGLFPQKTSWSWWIDHQRHQNDQNQSFFVDWISKNTNFQWYLVPLLLEDVE